MPLANERHERYAEHRARGATPKKAAISAGFAQGSSIYNALEDDPEVVLRIQELTLDFQLKKAQQREAAMQAAKMVGQVTGLNKSWVLQELCATVVAARQDGDHKSSIEALKLIGEEFAMFEGGSAAGTDDGTGGQTINLDDTHALLNELPKTLMDELPESILSGIEEPVETEAQMIDRLISGNKPVRVADRELSTGSETDVSLEIDDEEE